MLISVAVQLEAVLFLEPPKRVIQYTPSASAALAVASSTAAADAKLKQQAKPKFVRGPRVAKNVKRSQPEMASIYAEADGGQQASNKRSRLNEDEEEDVYPSDSDDHHHLSATTSFGRADTGRRLLPMNFDKVMGDLFDEFWNMEFDDHEVTWAFFAKITALNCKDYKLANFAETSSSLAVIKVSEWWCMV